MERFIQGFIPREERNVLLSDCDGTLFNSFALYDNALYSIIAKTIGEDLETTIVKVAGVFDDLNGRNIIRAGMSWSQIIDKVVEAFDLHDVDTMAVHREFVDKCVADIHTAGDTTVFPYTRQLLKQCKEAGIPVYIHTGTDRVFLKAFLDAAKLRPYIDGAVCGDDIPMSSKTDLVRMVANMCPGARSYTVFGDTRHDIGAGKDWHFKTVLVMNDSPWRGTHGDPSITPDRVFVDGFGIKEFISFIQE